jgi:hypothetical protein
MSYEEEFDRIIRRKAEEAEYPFDERDWEKANGMLDREQSRRTAIRLKRIIVPSAIAVTIGVAVMAISFLDTTEPSKMVSVISETHEKVQSEPQKLSEADNTAPAINTGADVAETRSGAVQTTNALPDESEAVSAGSAETTGNSGDAARISGTNLPSTPDLNNAASGTALTMPVVTPDQQKKTENATDIPVPAIDMTGLTAVEEPVAPELPYSIEAHGGYLPVESERDIVPAGVSLPQSYEDYFKNNYKSHWLTTEAGTMYNLGWNVNGTSDAAGINWYGVVQYGRYLSRKIAVSAGLEAYNIAGISKPTHETRTTDYSFGSTVASTMVTTTQLYYAGVPVKFHYVFRNGSRAGIGVNTGWLVAASNRIDTFAVRNDLPVTGSANVKGIYDNVNQLNAQVVLSFSYPVSRRFRVQGEVMYGVTDIFTASNRMATRENTQGLRVGIQYQLFDK